MAKKQVLDEVSKIRATDPSGVLGKVISFPKMLDQGLSDFSKKHLRLKRIGKFKSVVISGMGGSAIAGDLIRAALEDSAATQILVNRGYRLPRFIDRDSLFIAISYSGETEETLTCLKEAQARKLSIIAIASDGQLAAIAKENKFPCVILPPGLQPRAALPYILAAVLIILEKNRVAKTLLGAHEAIFLLDKLVRDYASNVRSSYAKQVAQDIQGKIPVILASDGITAAAALRFSSQLSENSKAFSHVSLVPEMNHNEIMAFEGKTPRKEDLCLIVIRDEGESDRIKKRIEITKTLLKDRVSSIKELWSTGKSGIARILSLVIFLDFVSVYLALLSGVDPAAIASIDLLKKEMSK